MIIFTSLISYESVSEIEKIEVRFRLDSVLLLFDEIFLNFSIENIEFLPTRLISRQ